MITEAALLYVVAGRELEFEAAFREASPLIASMPGYFGHSLGRSAEIANAYLLLVRWETVEHHTQGFRGSPAYDEWKRLLHHFYDPFPVVQHFRPVFELEPDLRGSRTRGQ